MCVGKKMIFVKEDVQDAGFSWPIYDGYINDSRECKGDNDNDSYLYMMMRDDYGRL